MSKLEFFFDCGSPWTYLAFHKIEEVAAEAGAELVWKPILVGGVFNAVNRGVYEARANPAPGLDLNDAKERGRLVTAWSRWRANPARTARSLPVRADADHRTSGPSRSNAGLAPTCSTRRFQLLPRK